MPEHKRATEKPSRQEVEFLEALRKRCPDYEPILEALGNLYTQSGRFHEGLQVDLELTRLKPDDAECWYNLACSQALTGDGTEALTSLKRAVEFGYDDADWMLSDPDLASLHKHPGFIQLVDELKARQNTRWNVKT